VKIGATNPYRVLQGFGVINYSPGDGETISEATSANGGLESAASVLRRIIPEPVNSGPKLHEAEGSYTVRLKREEGKHNAGFISRPFILCGLPARKPPRGNLLYESPNGNFVLEITAHPYYELRFGQDRIVPIHLAMAASLQQTILPAANLDARLNEGLTQGCRKPPTALCSRSTQPALRVPFDGCGKGLWDITREVHADVAGVAKGKGLGSRKTFLEGPAAAGGTKTRRAGPCLREGQRPLVSGVFSAILFVDSNRRFYFEAYLQYRHSFCFDGSGVARAER
jgi:hypothetical protein